MALVDLNGHTLSTRSASSLHKHAEEFERDEIVAFGVIAVYPDGSVKCDVGRVGDDPKQLIQLSQGCGTIVGYLRAEYKRSHAPGTPE